jgi:hypothetical protein
VSAASAQLRVQPLAGLADKTEQRMPSNLAGIGAVGALARAGRPVMLDQGRVQIERHRLPLEERMHARKQLVERALEPADVAQAEAAQKPADRGRVGQTMTPQQRLRGVRPQQRDVLEALAACDQRLAQPEDRLRGRVAAIALLHRHPLEQPANAKPAGQLAPA